MKFQEFQDSWDPCKRGPATAKDRSPAAVFDRGTNKRPELVERKCRLAFAAAIAAA